MCPSTSDNLGFHDGLIDGNDGSTVEATASGSGQKADEEVTDAEQSGTRFFVSAVFNSIRDGPVTGLLVCVLLLRVRVTHI